MPALPLASALPASGNAPPVVTLPPGESRRLPSLEPLAATRPLSPAHRAEVRPASPYATAIPADGGAPPIVASPRGESRRQPSLEPLPATRPPAPADRAEPEQRATVHIGTVEIHVTPPVPPRPPVPVQAQTSRPTPATTPATPLSRGYTSVFGLRQG
jgi:hypothetical protein